MYVTMYGISIDDYLELEGKVPSISFVVPVPMEFSCAAARGILCATAVAKLVSTQTFHFVAAGLLFDRYLAPLAGMQLLGF
jgi:hypothetical protein